MNIVPCDPMVVDICFACNDRYSFLENLRTAFRQPMRVPHTVPILIADGTKGYSPKQRAQTKDHVCRMKLGKETLKANSLNLSQFIHTH